MQRREQPVSEAELRAALASANGSPTDASKALGIHRVTVYKLMRRFGIEVRREVVTAAP